MTDTHLPPQWKEGVLAACRAPATKQNMRYLEAQARAEGGKAKWNPLNSTMHLDGSTIYNSFESNGVVYHVWNYPRPVWGVCATAMTLTNGNYNGILGDLQAGKKTAEQIVKDRRAQIRRWGTNPDLMLELLREIT